MKGVDEIVFALREGGRDGHWYANFSYYAAGVERKAYGRAGGGLYRLNVRTGKATPILEDAQGQVRDPQVHYDGRRIVFAYRKAGSEHYHLYEINADLPAGSAPAGQAGGTALRQLTNDDPYDDFEPTYLPDGGIMFVSSRCKRWVNCWLTQVAVLYRCDADGGNMRVLSANTEQDNTPWPLPDGRVLYTRWEYVDRSQVDYHHLWTANPDGSGQTVYYGNLRPGTVMIDAKPIPGTGKVAAIFSPGHGNREHAGPIYVVDPNAGPDEPKAARRAARGDNYRDVWAFSEHAFLAAESKRIVLLDDTGRVEALYTDARLEAHEPRPLIARPREPVIAPRGDLAQPVGRCVLSDAANGRNMTGVRPGQIRKLLVLESLPKPINYTGGMDPLTYGGTFTLERLMGTVPVEPDGSAYFELPALRGLFFVALDANDVSVKRMQSFMTVQPGETVGCVGCHEQRTQTALPAAGLLATRRPPSRIEPIAGVPDVLDFPRDIQPILDRHCVRCHDYRPHDGAAEGPRAGGVILTGDRGPMFSHSYITLTVRKQFVDGRNNPKSNLPPRAIGSSASPLMRKLGPEARVGGPDHHGVKVSRREADIVRCWIETGAAYPGTYASLGNGSIGGYYENAPVQTDFTWPETKAAAAALARRCDSCHAAARRLPHALADENDLSFWRPDWKNPRMPAIRHLVFNLTRPELSLMLLAPLGKPAGGLGMCRKVETPPPPAGKAPAATPKPVEPPEFVEVFHDAADADYQTILTFVRRGQAVLDEMKRFDMPGFRPPEPYVREMKRYGLLPPTFDRTRDPIDVYAADQAYWKSLWYRPPGGR
jgi:hypothetical protein